MFHVEIFTDGACRGNPGPGGWGVLLRYKHHEKSLSGAQAYTTNNRMELMAAIMGLAALKKKSIISVTTDSEYLRKGITEWIKTWKSNGWLTRNKKPVKNSDLWARLDEELKQHERVEWHWVKGHSGHPENEYVDQLANQAIDQLMTGLSE